MIACPDRDSYVLSGPSQETLDDWTAALQRASASALTKHEQFLTDLASVRLCASTLRVSCVCVDGVQSLCLRSNYFCVGGCVLCVVCLCVCVSVCVCVCVARLRLRPGLSGVGVPWLPEGEEGGELLRPQGRDAIPVRELDLPHVNVYYHCEECLCA